MGAARKLQVADLFCGAGGTSTGVALACKELDYAVELLAVNHWPRAIETHRKNHPWARHLCANIDQVDPREAVPGGYLDLLVASPECIWHSTARGGKPINDQKRASAWRVPEWCEKLYIRNLLIENVPEFRGWGPLDSSGRPLKSKRAQTFEAFIGVIVAMGYRVEYRVLNAADYGAATSRRRLFILARKGTRHIKWPSQTHSKDALKDGTIFRDLKPWRPARDIIDWSIEGQSIFARKKPLARTTLLRIRAGLLRYGGPLAPLFVSALDAYMAGKTEGDPVEVRLDGRDAEAFITVLNANNTPKSVDAPLPTVTGGNRLFMTQPHMTVLRGTKDAQVSASIRSVDEPVPTLTAGGGHAGIVEPQAFVVEMEHSKNGSAHVRPITDPFPTLTTAKGGSMGVAEPAAFMLPGRQFDLNGADSIDKPIRTVMPTHTPSLVRMKAFLVPGYGERPGQDPRTHDVDAPVPTLPCSSKFGIADAVIVTPGGANLPNGKPVSDPLPTVMTSDRLALAVPVIVQPTHGGGDERRCSSIESPLPTQPCTNRHGIAFPVVVQVNHVGGDSGRTQSVDDPLKAATTHNGHALAIAKFYGEPEKNVAGVDEPVPTVTCKDRFGLVEGVVTRIGIDIRFRMFKTHELARAMGFEQYHFTGTTEEITRQIGNAVEVNQAKALVRALLEG